MKRLLLIGISLLVFALSQPDARADDQVYLSGTAEEAEAEQYMFVGLTGSYLNGLNESGVGGLRLGFQNSLWRTIFAVEGNSDQYKAFLIEADRTVIAGLLGGKGRIYLGLSGGWMQFSDDLVVINQETAVELKNNGYAYGGNIGFMFYLTDQIDMSLEYRYLVTQNSCVCGEENIHGATLALHYFF